MQIDDRSWNESFKHIQIHTKGFLLVKMETHLQAHAKYSGSSFHRKTLLKKLNFS